MIASSMMTCLEQFIHRSRYNRTQKHVGGVENVENPVGCFVG